MDLNKVMIIGNVTQDPEVRTTTQGSQVTSFGVATNLTWTDQNGMKQSKAEFHNVVAWRKLAEICGQYLNNKGRRSILRVVYRPVIGKIRWCEAEGLVTEIVADNMIMLIALAPPMLVNCPRRKHRTLNQVLHHRCLPSLRLLRMRSRLRIPI